MRFSRYPPPDVPVAPSRPAPGRRLLAAGIALAIGALAAIVTVNARAAVPVPSPGWSLVFADDFTGPPGGQPSNADWRYTQGTAYPGGLANFGTGEVENNTRNPENISFDGKGNLRITPIRGAGSFANWTSARLETNRADFKPAPGTVLRIESRIKMPDVTGTNGLGYWPSFTAIGAPFRGNLFNLPGVGAFDFADNVNGLDQVSATVHCGLTWPGPCNEPTGLRASRTCSGPVTPAPTPGLPPGTCHHDFHVYRFQWDRSISPNQLRRYLDGALFHVVYQNQIDPATWAAFTSHQGYFLLLKVAIGGTRPTIPAGRGAPTPPPVSRPPPAGGYVPLSPSPRPPRTGGPPGPARIPPPRLPPLPT